MKRFLILASFAILITSCKHEVVIPEYLKTPEISYNCDSDIVYFVNDIQPLLNSTCATTGCHDQQSAEHGVILTSYENIIQTGEVKPFRPNDSELYEVLFEDGDDLMPPSPQSPLSTNQKEMIRIWIMQGAKNNECREDCNTEFVSFSSDISNIISNNCTSCHSGAEPNGGILLTNYSEISAIANSGILMNVLMASSGAPQMPPTGAMNNCNIDKINKWIEDGTPNN